MVVNIVVPNFSGYFLQVIDIRLKYLIWEALRFNIAKQIIIARLQVLRGVLLKRKVFRNVMPFRLGDRCWHFERSYYLHFTSHAGSSSLPRQPHRHVSAYGVSTVDWGIKRLPTVATPQSPISYVTHLYHLQQLLTLHCLTPKIKLVSKRR